VTTAVGKLSRGVHRYWQMQFCCSACMTAYQQRLAPETKAKIKEAMLELKA
jgi:hypothetical protein